MDWLVVWFGIQAGLFSQSVVISPHGGMWQTPPNTFEVTMDAKALFFEHLEVGGFMRSYQTPIDAADFNPFRIDYGINAAIIWGPLKVGVTRECDHQVSQLGNGNTGLLYGSGFFEFFIRFESKVTF